MADMSKAERLAAARRKLQDFQRSKGRPLTSPPELVSNTSQPSLEQDSTLLLEPHHQPQHSQASEYSLEEAKLLSFHNSSPHSQTSTSEHELNNRNEGAIFGSNLTAHNDFQSLPPPIDDNVTLRSPQYLDTQKDLSNSSFASSPKVFSASSFFDSVSGFSSDPSISLNEFNLNSNSDLSTPLNTASHLFSTSSVGNQNWNVDFHKPPTVESISNSSVVNSPFLDIRLPHAEETSAEQRDSSSSLPIPAENPHENPSYVDFSLDTSDLPVQDLSKETKPEATETETISLHERSSTEFIRQLSDQITQLLDAPLNTMDSQSSSPSSSLELRNQELAGQLSAERRNNQQLQFSLKESQSLVSHLEAKVLDLQSQQEVVLARHIGPLQEQLRAHAQTVGILVGEKTELEAALAHHNGAAKQHASEVEELQNRLRASRHRVSELEKELSTLSVTANTADKQRSDHVHELDQLRLQNSMLSKQLEDAEEEASELRQKLGTRIAEAGALEQQLQERQSQLSLAQLRVTQLSSSDNPEASAEIESLHQHKISLERRCAELLETVRQLTAERDQADHQYQQYVAQLNGQLQAASAKLESANIENEKLRCREQDLVRNMSELERQLQQLQLQNFQNQQLMDSKVSAVCSEDHSGVFERVSQLEEDRQNLTNSLDMQAQEVSRLKIDLEERDARIAELEALCNEKPDQALLLAAMESDKVAAAQATSQNTILKQQLQELQDGFIKMSNDKLHLTEDLEHEKHVNKEMGEKISQLAEELHELRVLVSEKERLLQHYQQSDHNHDHSHENCGDLNHNLTYVHKHEAESINEHSHESDEKTRLVNGHEGLPSDNKPEETAALQEQLSQAKDHIHNLSSQNNSLRRLLAQKSTESHESGSSSSATEGATTDDAAADPDTTGEDLQNKGSSYLTMQYAMEKLQERFTRTMAEVAELTEEKQRLEHLVLQLQGETETIGEYVTLYQIQRSVLQQRAREKDHQLACLSAEREDLRRKLNDLNILIHRLVEENNSEAASEALPALSNYISNGDVLHSPDGTIDEHSLSGNTEDSSNSEEDPTPSTAGKILALLSEIGSSSLVDTNASGSETFHPCPWCSGRLITV